MAKVNKIFDENFYFESILFRTWSLEPIRYGTAKMDTNPFNMTWIVSTIMEEKEMIPPA